MILRKESGTKWFLIPEFPYTYTIGSTLSISVSASFYDSESAVVSVCVSDDVFVVVSDVPSAVLSPSVCCNALE